MKIALPLIIFSFVFCNTLAQTSYSGQTSSSLYFRQFFFNPYLVNPAYVGSKDYTEVNLAYRQQWLHFKDAPTTVSLSIQYPTQGRVSLGLNILSDKSVALQNSIVMGTFGYRVPLNENQSLRFGLSGGVGMNNLNLTADELANPALTNTNTQNYYVDGNFGVLYNFKGLNIGFALPKLFNTNTFSTQAFNDVKTSNLQNRTYSASYRFKAGVNNISLEPYVLYRQRADHLNAWEAATTVYFKDTFWAGAAYHQTNGLGVYFGMNVKNIFKFSYSYDFPPSSLNFTSYSSHELHIGVLLGKKKHQIKTTLQSQSPQQYTTHVDSTTVTKNFKKEVLEAEDESLNKIDQTNSVEEKGNEPAIVEQKEKTVVKEPVAKEPVITKHEDKPVNPRTTIVKQKKPSQSFTLGKGSYVVVGVFSIMDNSMRYMKRLMDKGSREVSVALNPKNNKYYVYTFSSYDVEEARKARNQYRLRRPFSEAWVLTIE